MKFPKRLIIVVLVALLAGVTWGVLQRLPGQAAVPKSVLETIHSSCAEFLDSVPLYDPGQAPEGWSPVLRLAIDGEMLVYGPIEAHYWREGQGSEVICGLHYNTGRTSATAEPDNILLFVVEGVYQPLPLAPDEVLQPDEPYRVLEILLDDAPEAWLATAPDEPGWVYWRSLYHPRRRAAVHYGYWLRHIGVREFEFDFGDPTGAYPFTHNVYVGIDTEFAPKIKFDAGP